MNTNSNTGRGVANGIAPQDNFSEERGTMGRTVGRGADTSRIDEIKSRAARTFSNRAGGVSSYQRGEGRTTKAIERFTTQIPSGTFLSLALGSVVLSATLRMSGRPEDANFVGQWVPSILLLGLYNKLVRLEGSE